MSDLTFPAPAGFGEVPHWTGTGFRLGDAVLPVLEYSENFEGWSDDLTALHEEAAGATHPIDVASRNDALAQIKTHVRNPESAAILEIGCSSGFMIKAITRAFPSASIVGADVVREPLFELAKQMPNVPLLRFDVVKCPLLDNSFDAVVLLNVLEHIQDDSAALAQVFRILKPGGIAIIEVPAGPHLFDAYDKALKHFRRYRISELAQKMLDAGFKIQRKSHLGFFVYPAFAAVKRRNQRAFRDSNDPESVVRNQASESSSSRMLSLAVAFEGLIAPWFNYPIGVRCLAVGKKA
jgi:SAM-dependent methyltransferase